MVYPNDYTIKFYDGFTLVYEIELIASSPKEAIRIALKQIKGLSSFTKIRIIKRL